MPTYEYLCSTCGHRFDVIQSMRDEPLSTCLESECAGQNKGKGTVARIISGGGGVVYKGEGFYLTDYKRKTTSSTTKSEGGGQTPSETPAEPSAPKADAKNTESAKGTKE